MILYGTVWFIFQCVESLDVLGNIATREYILINLCLGMLIAFLVMFSYLAVVAVIKMWKSKK